MRDFLHIIIAIIFQNVCFIPLVYTKSIAVVRYGKGFCYSGSCGTDCDGQCIQFQATSQ